MPSLSGGPVRLRTTPGWEFFHRYDVTQDGFQVFIRYVDHMGQRWHVDPLSLTKQNPTVAAAATLDTSSPLRMDGKVPDVTVGPDINGFLQEALELAWEIGMRPTGYAEPSNELAAVRYHLEDMRKLAKVR